jgi:hypothetical protein
LVTQCEEKDAKLSICSLLPYQNEMLMPHCRHDFVESCPPGSADDRSRKTNGD